MKPMTAVTAVLDRIERTRRPLLWLTVLYYAMVIAAVALVGAAMLIATAVL